jgi:glutathione synthase
MPLHVAVVMDPIGSILIAKDTSFAMLLEAQRRGHHLHYVLPGGLGVADGRAIARLAPLAVRDDPASWYTLGPARSAGLAEMDVMLMRRDPPVDAEYLHDSIVLSMAQAEGVLVANDPGGLRDLNEKLAALLFPACCPPTLVSRDGAELRAFVAEHRECVLKPLDGMGGRSIFRVVAGEANVNVILETLTAGGRHLAMAQRYIPEIREGDKRILLVDGEPVPYCLARIPQGSEFRGNLAKVGRSASATAGSPPRSARSSSVAACCSWAWT